MTITSPEEGYLTVKEAAAYARRDPQTIRRWFYEGKIIRYRSGHRVLVKITELDAQITPVPAVPSSDR